MNIALTSITDIDLSDHIRELSPHLILSSTYKQTDLKLADLALQLDEKIHLEGYQIDLVCVANRSKFNPVQISNFIPDYVDRIYYTKNNLHASSFYCNPNVFSMLGNLYKIDFDRYDFRNIDQDTVELLTEKIFFIANRLGIEIKYA